MCLRQFSFTFGKSSMKLTIPGFLYLIKVLKTLLLSYNFKALISCIFRISWWHKHKIATTYTDTHTNWDSTGFVLRQQCWDWPDTNRHRTTQTHTNHTHQSCNGCWKSVDLFHKAWFDWTQQPNKSYDERKREKLHNMLEP